MRKYLIVCTLGCAMAMLCVSPASADRVDELDKQIQALQKELNALRGEIKQAAAPGPKTASDGPDISMGADHRIRGVMKDNMWNFDLDGGLGYDDSWEWYRMRTRLWLKALLDDEMSLYLRAANEYKWGIDHKGSTLSMDPDFDELIGNKELFLDNAYFDWNAPFGQDWLALRVGRQDLIYGEGFVILDGQSNVGSMAIAFDGVKATVTNDFMTADLLYSKIQEDAKQFADDEDFFGLYVKTDVALDALDTSLHWEPYLLHRNRNAVDNYTLPGGVWPVPPLTADMFVDPALHTTLLGTRFVLPLSIVDEKDLTLVSEGGYQWGEIEDPTGLAFLGTDSYGENSVDREAYSAYLYAKYNLGVIDAIAEYKPYVKTGFYLMSGDDPDTDEYEGWDSFYAEWPKFSEGLVYQLYDPFVPLKMTANGPTDRDLGTWTNMRILQGEVGFSPIEKLQTILSYQYLWADEKNSLLNDDERDRGQLLTAIANFKLNKWLSGHVRGEYFMPGDFYDPAGDSPDDSLFARYELMVKF